MIDDKDGHIPSPLIMFTSIALHHTLMEWQKNKGVLPKASKSKVKADRPDRSNYFNYKNDADMIASCYAATGCKVLTLPGVVDTYTFLMNTWNTLPESFQHGVYKNILATVKGQIQQAEDRMPAAVIGMEAVRVDIAILLDYLTSEVVFGQPGIGSSDPNILIDNNCRYEELHFGMPGGCENYDDAGDKIDQSDAIPTASRRQRAANELERFDPGSSAVDAYEGDSGDDADADEEEEASQDDDELTPTLED
jgi:hypothetical protein